MRHMQKQKFVPKTALIVSTILLAAGGIATTSTAYAGSFRGLPQNQAMSWFASPKKKEPGKGMNQGYLVFHNSKTTYKGKAKKAENILKASHLDQSPSLRIRMAIQPILFGKYHLMRKLLAIWLAKLAVSMKTRLRLGPTAR